MDKTEFMIIASRYRLENSEGITDISLALGDNNIKRVNNKKFIGFIIDDLLKWGTHIYTQCKKITKNIALLRRAKPYPPLQAVIKMYHALVLRHLAYCSTIWNGSNIILNRLSKLQRRAARVITGRSYDIRSTKIFESLNWLPFKDYPVKR